MTGTPRSLDSTDELALKAAHLVDEFDRAIIASHNQPDSLGKISNVARQAARNFGSTAVHAAVVALGPDAASTILCSGSGKGIHTDDTDGNGVATCPGCCRYRATTRVNDTWSFFENHTPPPNVRGGAA